MSYLYLGDIGGNKGSSTVRSEIKIVRMPEPAVDLAWAGNPRKRLERHGKMSNVDS